MGVWWLVPMSPYDWAEFAVEAHDGDPIRLSRVLVGTRVDVVPIQPGRESIGSSR